MFGVVAKIETFGVFTFLALSALVGGGGLSDWLTCGAVLLSFLCTQAAFDLADQQDTAQGAAAVAARYRVIYVVKEIFWIASCIALGSVPLLASTLIFSTYPAWRRITKPYRQLDDLSAIRSRLPLQRA